MRLLGALAGVLALIIGVGWIVLRASLPQVDGMREAAALDASVTIERDRLGVPTLRGSTRADLAYATGLVHAQDRFFQMDLLRRVASGEVSALIGKAALELDRRNRPHRFRERARRLVDALPADQRQLIERYTAGVNDGIASLTAKPFEYWVLRTRPAAWRPEDSLLVVYSMYFDLQFQEVNRILSRAALRERVPADLFAFLLPAMSRWDAPFDLASPPRAAPETPPATRPDWLRAAKPENVQQRNAALLDDSLTIGNSMVGSNGWVVDEELRVEI